MVCTARTVTLALTLLVPLSILGAETPPDPSGHWEGGDSRALGRGASCRRCRVR